MINKLSLHKKLLSSSYADVEQFFMECPDCGLQTASYFISPEMAQKQIELRGAAASWNIEKSRLNFNRLVKLRQEYSNLFDTEQEKYKNFSESLDSLKEAVAEHASEF